jgi:4'-phosphopantetheinyl transferase
VDRPPPRELYRSVLAPSEIACLERLPPAETTRAFLSYWTRKEALVKATGDGITESLPGVVVSPPEEPARLLSYEGKPALAERTVMADLHRGPGHVATAAVIGDGPYTFSELDTAQLSGCV